MENLTYDFLVGIIFTLVWIWGWMAWGEFQRYVIYRTPKVTDKDFPKF